MTRITREDLRSELRDIIAERRRADYPTPQEEIEAADVDWEGWEELAKMDTASAIEALAEVVRETGVGETAANPITSEQFFSILATQLHDGFLLGLRLGRKQNG